MIIPKVKVIQKGDSIHFDVQLNTASLPSKMPRLHKIQQVRIEHGELNEVLFSSADLKYYYKEVPYQHLTSIRTYLYLSTASKEYKFDCGEIYWEHRGE